MVRGRLITGPLPTLQRDQTLVGGWGTAPILDVETPLPGVAREVPAPPPPVRRTASLLDGETEREENLFIPPPVLKRGGEKLPSTTMILPPTDSAPIQNPFSEQPSHSWRRAFLAGGLLGGLVVGAISFHAEVARFVSSRLHKIAPQPSAIAVPTPAAAPAPVPTAGSPTPPPPVAPIVEEEHAPPPPAAAEANKAVEEPAAAEPPLQRKAAIAGDRRVPLRGTRLPLRPGAIARRKGGAGHPASAPDGTGETAAPAKGENWVDPFSDGTWTKIPSDE
jgi:hypothetical protein